MLGAAVTTSSIAVGSRCIFASAGVGAALTQHVTDPRLGPVMLGELRRELGVSYMFISHDISTVRAICDEVIVLYAGQCVEAGQREYLVEQLRNFASGARRNDSHAQMRNMARALSAPEIDEVSSYYARHGE